MKWLNAGKSLLPPPITMAKGGRGGGGGGKKPALAPIFKASQFGDLETLAEILDAEQRENEIVVGDTVVRFVADGPKGRPELFGELFS